MQERTYLERRSPLLGLLAWIGQPIQAVAATDEIETARAWYD
ncbi:DNA ligase-like domain-containing protein [Streptomyces caniscabiei]|nr:hypothetical protein [Streptomyces caniscabiei]MDX3726474.1 hypothetical protein [Streptomyces caniscabiei]